MGNYVHDIQLLVGWLGNGPGSAEELSGWTGLNQFSIIRGMARVIFMQLLILHQAHLVGLIIWKHFQPKVSSYKASRPKPVQYHFQNVSRGNPDSRAGQGNRHRVCMGGVCAAVYSSSRSLPPVNSHISSVSHACVPMGTNVSRCVFMCVYVCIHMLQLQETHIHGYTCMQVHVHLCVNTSIYMWVCVLGGAHSRLGHYTFYSSGSTYFIF